MACAVAAAGLFVSADTWKEGDPSMSCVLVTAAVALSFVGALITTFQACRHVPGYVCLKPFQGGAAFGMLQAHGWGMLGCLLAAGTVEIAALSGGWAASIVDYVLSVCGLLAVLGNGVLVHSLEHHDRASKQEVLRTQAIHKTSAAVAGGLSALSTLLYVAADSYRKAGVAPQLCGAAAALGVAAAAATHISAARNTPGWRTIQPYVGGPFFVLLQAEGWLWLAVSSWSAVLAYTGGWAVEDAAPGVLTFIAAAQAAANLMLGISPAVFSPDAAVAKAPAAKPEPEPSQCVPFHQLLWGTGVLLAVAPAMMHGASKLLGTPLGCMDAVAVTGAMFLSAPVSHMSGTLRHRDYRVFQAFRGGQRFVLSQSFGWALYAASVIASFLSAVNGLYCNTDILLPLVFFAQMNLAMSVTYFDPSEIVEPVKTVETLVEPEQLPDDAGIPLWAAACGAFAPMGAIAAAYLSGSMSTETLGLCIFGGISLVTLAGLHIVFTQVWLIMTIGLLLAGSESGLGVMAACGWNVSVMWYGANFIAMKDRAPQRAMSGWGLWTCENLLGDVFRYPLPNWEKGGAPFERTSYISYQGSFPLGFIILDIAFHLMPCLALLQMAADIVTAQHAVIAYVGARVLSVAVTARHVRIDYPRIYAHRRVHWRVTTEPRVTPFVDGGVVAEIYGMEPPPSYKFFFSALALEALGTLSLAAITMLPQKAEILRAMGLSMVLTPESILKVIMALTPIGLVSVFGGVVVARLMLMPKELRNPKSWTRRGGMGPWGVWKEE
eukprot:TRINITY_DN4278_c0_g5_i1.p1 TRINITY_DN4278_c0_g5~~TRINITY_DN4278_c0_g5_i1.p1  ORF type:complete len:829 (+),score=277.86 TRINITY_DN4278_c0_g5_i1:161-2488(+)